MRKCVIMRGIPGSGKSTYVRLNHPEAFVFSSDHYHMKDGEYRYDEKRAQLCHDLCLSGFMTWARLGRSPLVCDNTNTTAWEVAPYYRIAEICGYDVQIVFVWCPFEVAEARNVHNVPPEKMFRMWQGLNREVLPSHWRQRIVVSHRGITPAFDTANQGLEQLATLQVAPAKEDSDGQGG